MNPQLSTNPHSIQEIPDDDTLTTILNTLTSNPTSSTSLSALKSLTKLTSFPSPSTLATILTQLTSTLPSESQDDLNTTILQSYLRPLFQNSTPLITPSGRPSAYTDQNYRPPSTPPWKAHSSTILLLFTHAVSTSTQSYLQQKWPLFTPVLLTLIDDQDSSIRTSGLEILAMFLGKCPADVLTSTGIGKVFADAIFPSLLYLPSLTPEDESVRMLTQAYTALYGLASKNEAGKRALLDRVLREGVFTGYEYASGYPRIVQLLMAQTTTIINTLGLFTAKHLQNLLAMISQVMKDPFIIPHPSTLLEASKALNAIITNCWPRMQAHEAQFTRIIAICWLNLHEELDSQPKPSDLERLTRELKKTAKILRRLRQGGVPTEIAAALQREPQLKVLFSE